MRKLKTIEYSLYIYMFLMLYFIVKKQFLYLAIVILIHLLLFGFVSIASFFSNRGKHNISDFLLKLTIPNFLIKYQKAVYYFTLAINLGARDKTKLAEAFIIAKKVNADDLYADANKMAYYLFMLALANSMGETAQATTYLEIARKIPHEANYNKVFEEFEKAIKNKANQE